MSVEFQLIKHTRSKSMEKKEVTINVMEAKAVLYDYIMSHIVDKDFEDTAAVARDVFERLLDIGK